MAFNVNHRQKELCYIQQMGGAASRAYNESLVYRLSGDFQPDVFERALRLLTQKHVGFRTFFKQADSGHYECEVSEETAIDCERIVLSEKQSERDLVAAIMSASFSLDTAPLLRVRLIKVRKSHWLLVCVMHHIIIDGASLNIFVSDLNDFYNACLSGDVSSVNAGIANDYAFLLSDSEPALVSQKQVDAVAQSLLGYEKLNLLTTPDPSPDADIFSGGRSFFTLPEITCDGLKSLACEQRATLFHAVFSIYVLLLSQYARVEDIVVGVPYANRMDKKKQSLVAYLANVLPVRVALNPDETFLTLMAHVKKKVFSYLNKQAISFSDVLDQLDLPRAGLGKHPLLQTLFVLGDQDKLALNFQGVDAQLDTSHHNHTAKFDLSLFMLSKTGGGISGFIEYKAHLFDGALVDAMVERFSALIDSVVANPAMPLSSLLSISESEACNIKENYFSFDFSLPAVETLPGLFAQSVVRYPDRVAVRWGNQDYTYSEVNKLSDQWALRLKKQYASFCDGASFDNVLIALSIDRSVDMIVGMLAILKLGAAYVPIDPQYPESRIHYIMAHSQAVLLLTHWTIRHLFFSTDAFKNGRVIYMDEPAFHAEETLLGVENKVAFNQVEEIAPTFNVSPLASAYVLYTSGSTGRPKGVSVTHDNVVNLFFSLRHQFDFQPSDVWSLFHTVCFDISVWEIWGALSSGGKLLLIPYDVTRDVSQFYALIKKEKVSVLSQTASAFQMFVSEDLAQEEKLSALRYVAFVGESLKVSILKPWAARYGYEQPVLANMYGITETTVYTNYKFISAHDVNKGRDNIGWPLKAFSMCVMSDDMTWCPVGVVGEICIGGRGLSKGYLNQPALTKERFVSDPYAQFLGLSSDEKLYKTGDLGRWLPDGSIEYLGRKDFQIKLRGFRIELGEIEAALGSFPGVTYVTVLLKGLGNEAMLCAYYVVEPGATVSVSMLRSHVSACVPGYMLPNQFIEVGSMPMTLNGKVDRNALLSISPNLVDKPVQELNTDLEKHIAQVWKDILNQDTAPIGLDTNFFELGGNSLLVMKMFSALRSVLPEKMLLARFLSSPTISTLVSPTQTNSCDPTREALIAKIKADCELPVAIKPVLGKDTSQYIKPVPSLERPEGVLITGVTGFLGAHLLYELLHSTTAKIYCLVRASSQETALARVQDVLEKYHLSVNQYVSRIVPVRGDLALNQLGLSDDVLNTLVEEVDSIFHVGALVNHVLDYQTLFAANVASVITLLKVSCQYKNKAFHFVSTLGTALISPTTTLNDTCSPLDYYLNGNGYLVSKWVSEALVEAAHARGVAAYVYRPGNITAGREGIYEPDKNHTLLRLKGMLQLKAAYVNNDKLEMTPVDQLAKEIFTISQSPKKVSYCLYNPNALLWRDYLRFAHEQGFYVRMLSNPSEWDELLDGLGEENALFQFSHLYRSDFSREVGAVLPDFPCSDMLASSFPSYQQLLEDQFPALLSKKFLDEEMKNKVLVS